MSEAQDEVKESAAVVMLRKRVRDINTLIGHADDAIKESHEHIAEVTAKRAQHYTDRAEIEGAIARLTGGAA